MSALSRIAHRVERLALRASTARWRILLGEVGKGATIAPTARIRGDWSRLRVGQDVAVGDFVHVWASGGVEIGANSLIAAHSVISSQSHVVEALSLGQIYSETRDDKPVSIGSNVWIASNVVVGPGVTIGDNSVIAAGAVVIADVPSAVLAAGVPARVVRSLPEGGASTSREGRR